MTNRQIQVASRNALRTLVSADKPSLFVSLETRDRNGNRKPIGQGIVSGWGRDFATIWLVEEQAAYEFAWTTIARAVAASSPLLV